MMPVECAIVRGMKACQRIHDLIEANERNWQCMDGKHRNEMGAWRCLMHHVGVPKDQLPEMPFLDPAHLEAYRARIEEYEAHRPSASCEAEL